MRFQVICIAFATIIISTTFFIVNEIPTEQSFTDIQINLNRISFTNDITVNHMNKITLQEANNIKNNITETVNKKLNSLNCQENTDYTIAGLNLITENEDLNSLINSISVNSISTSKKVTGSSTVIINVKENINDRKFDPPIQVPKSQENSLSQWWADYLQSEIKRQAINIINVSQTNVIGIDYNIDNIDNIKKGATFKSFKDIIYIQSIPTSTRLTGSFKVDFLLDSN